jgi:thiamine biosynthesis lipoprotein
MGCEIVVVLPALQSAAVEVVQALFARWEQQLSRFRADSELTCLNALAGRPVRTGPLLRAVLRRALSAAELTDGVFDPTMGGDIAALGYARGFGELPVVVDRTLPPRAGGGWRDIRIGADGTISLPRGVAIDVGGIAKGMSVDASLAALRARGVDSALISAGGDLAVTGSLPGRRPWPVAVEGGEAVALSRGALATSSVERRRWRTAVGEHHHLLDPRTRRPADGGLVRVTAHAATCEAAEVAAKTALILGPDAGPRFLERSRVAALVATGAGARPVGAWPLPEYGVV